MSDDIASPRKRYSNWLMGNSHASPQGVASKRSHLPGGRVVLTGPGSAPVVLFFVFFPPLWDVAAAAARRIHYQPLSWCGFSK